MNFDYQLTNGLKCRWHVFCGFISKIIQIWLISPWEFPSIFGNSLLLLGDENNDWIHWKFYTKLSKTLHRVNIAAGVYFYALIALLFISIHKLLCRDKRRRFTLLWCLCAVIFALVDSFKWSFKTSSTLKSLINWSILMSNKFKLKWPRKVYFKSAQWLNPKKTESIPNPVEARVKHNLKSLFVFFNYWSHSKKCHTFWHIVAFIR